MWKNAWKPVILGEMRRFASIDWIRSVSGAWLRRQHWINDAYLRLGCVTIFRGVMRGIVMFAERNLMGAAFFAA